MAVRHFDEWWMFGSTYTLHWAPGGQVLANNSTSTDLINNYVLEGLDGGIIKLALLIVMIVTKFNTVGRYVNVLHPIPKAHAIFVWAVGVGLSGHALMFSSVSYFDQIVVIWY